MRVACLGSGSGGNAFLVEAGSTRVLVDAGFSGVQIERRLRAVEVEPESVSAVVITHDHRDHTSGAGVAARRWGWPLYMSPRTARACGSLLGGEEEVRPFRGLRPFRIGELEVRPFFTCHDAADPLAVTVVEVDTGLEVAVATDLGRATTAVRAALRRCHFLVLEANHDERLLRDGPYPWSVKRRIGGSRGHLSNRLAADLASELEHPDLGGVLLAHLSRECNDPALAAGVVGERLALRGYDGWLGVAGQEDPTAPPPVSELVARRRGGEQLRLFR